MKRWKKGLSFLACASVILGLMSTPVMAETLGDSHSGDISQGVQAVQGQTAAAIGLPAGIEYWKMAVGAKSLCVKEAGATADMMRNEGVEASSELAHSLLDVVKSARAFIEKKEPTRLSNVTDTTAECWAFGDSLVAGQIPTGDGGGHSDYNYPTMTARRLGMKIQNKAIGGTGVIKDNEKINELIDGLDMTKARLIIVGYGGYNESSTVRDTPMGTYTDKEEESFVGYYYRLMAKLQEKCPYATVVYVSGCGLPKSGEQKGGQFEVLRQFADGEHSWGDLYDELEMMCNLNGWPCVNQHHVGSAINVHNCDTLVGSDNKHLTNEGYKTYGNFLSAKIATCFSNLA